MDRQKQADSLEETGWEAVLPNGKIDGQVEVGRALGRANYPVVKTAEAETYQGSREGERGFLDHGSKDGDRPVEQWSRGRAPDCQSRGRWINPIYRRLET